MAKRIKKSIPWFVILALIGLVIGIGLNFSFDFKSSEVKASTAGTSVTVGNVAPVFSVTPYEDPACHSGSGTAGTTDNPVNVGSNVVMKAQATDANGDQWYLAICSGANPPTASGVADCVSGTTYGKSGLVNQGANTATANCSTTGLTSESYAWYAYACDSSTGANKCSTVSQGSGNPGTPFYVNHGASFTAVTDADEPSVPGGTVTITTPSGSDDPDTVAADDTLTLYVCKESGATASAGCTGAKGEWCHSTANPQTDPTCNWTMDVTKTDNVTNNQCEGAYDYYPYIFDNHGFAATGVKQGLVATNTVSNVAPDVTAVSLNSGSDFQLTTPESSDNIVVTGTVVDANGCVDIDDATTADASIYYYKSGVAEYANCDDSPGAEDDDNYCYSIRDCVYDAGTCTGTADSSSTFTCTVAIKYHARPTDGASLNDSTWYLYTWRATLIGSDGTASDTLESSEPTEMKSFMAYDVNDGSATIAYGNPLAPGDTSADKTNTVEALGNVGLDTKLYATVANMCSDYPTCAGSTMAIAQQHWAASDIAWASMTTLTTTTSDELELNCAKSTSATPANALVHWKIQIPGAQASASYTGLNTILGITGEATSW